MIENRLQALRALMDENKLDAVIVSKYVNLHYLSGFRGDDTMLVIGREKAMLITDSRYTEQAAQQAPLFELVQQKDGLLQKTAECVKAIGAKRVGFSVNVEDIDSSYTLGDIARRYQQILERLTQEGLANKNKLLPTPFDIQNVLVIAPENAAGLGDFKKDADALDKAGVCHFVYHNATFQGNTAAVSIINSLGDGLRQWAKDFKAAPDLIVIIRGGGAVNDLAYLNDYDRMRLS